MKRAILASLALSALAATAADTLAPGKYSGIYDLNTRTGPVQVSVQLDLAQVNGDNVTGTMVLNRLGSCDGNYVMEGKYSKGTLALHSTQGGRAGDCKFSMKVRTQGDKLVGKTGGGRPLELTKK